MNKKQYPKKTQLQKNDIITLDIDSLAYGGEGVHKNNGLVLFVPRGLPGDRLKVRIKRIKKQYGSAEIISIIKPSVHRIASSCPSFNRGCGGCQWLQLDYNEQLKWKAKIVKDTFKHLGKINVNVAKTIGMSNINRGRNKLSLHNDNQGRIGLMKEQSHTIIPFKNCIQEMKSIEESCQSLLKFRLSKKVSQVHFRASPEGEVNITLFEPRIDKKELGLYNKIIKTIPAVSGISIATFTGYIKSIGKPGIVINIVGLKYFVPSTGFFQTNYEQAENLVNLVHRLASPKSTDTILDLYCGVGFFTLDLARKCKHIIGIESNKEAVKAAKKNAKINNISNIFFMAGEAREAIYHIKQKSFDTIVLDPARVGCDAKVISKIISFNPSKIIYVSCSPDTQVRDIQPLIKSGYIIDTCQPLDMFPNTYHVENVIRLVKRP